MSGEATSKDYSVEESMDSSLIDCDKRDGLNSDDHENSDKTAQSVNKKSSIDVTKALLLLGFVSWSSLIEGMWIIT